jgi:hypothetical protein
MERATDGRQRIAMLLQKAPHAYVDDATFFAQ